MIGGLIQLRLGSEKPTDFVEIAALIRAIINREVFYTVSVFDIDTNRYYQDVQILLADDTGTPNIRCTRFTENGTIRVFTYYFNDITGAYNKKVITFTGLTKTE